MDQFIHICSESFVADALKVYADVTAVTLQTNTQSPKVLHSRKILTSIITSSSFPFAMTERDESPVKGNA